MESHTHGHPSGGQPWSSMRTQVVTFAMDKTKVLRVAIGSSCVSLSAGNESNGSNLAHCCDNEYEPE